MSTIYRVKVFALPLGLIVIGLLAALAAFKTTGHDPIVTFPQEKLADAVNSDFTANNEGAQGAPQQ